MAVPAGAVGAGTGGALMGGVPVVVCRSCDGLAFTLDPCRCTYGGDRFLVTVQDRPVGEAYRDCRDCQGVGTLARPCHDCRQTGRRRAQLVLTMANLDTGAVASANVVPGVVEPVPWDGDGGGSWHLPLAPLLQELAVLVGAGSWRDVRAPGDPDGPLVLLPRAWRPEQPASTRRALEAEAIAGESLDGWRLYLGHTTVVPARDPAASLGRWCRLADLLCLDLVVEARRMVATDALTWAIRFEMPGGPVPAETYGYADDLTTAITTTTDLDAFYGLEERGRTVPAYQPAIRHPPPDARPTVDLDQLERRILADCTDLATGNPHPGAQAVWRDGRWWHTALRIDGTTETLTEWTTGQIHCRRTPSLRRGWQPPAPSWQGPPIGYVDCPDCDPHSRLRACDCRLGTNRIDPDCPRCAGSGRSPSLLRCYTCWGSHRLHSEVTVTITDLASRVVQLGWRTGPTGWQTGEHTWRDDPTGEGDGPAGPAGEEHWRAGQHVPAPHIANHPGGKPLHQLPDQFRLAGWADHFGVRPEDLVELDGGGSLDHGLRDGIVTLDRPDADPLTEYLRWAARGRPGARLFLLARRPDVPPLADLVRLVLGLHLTITITLTDHIHNAGDPRYTQGESWDVTINRPDRPPAPANPPTHASPEAATTFCLDYLELAIANNIPTNPDQPIPVPQNPTPIAVDDPIPPLRRLARHHPGQPVAAHYDSVTCQIWLREHHDVRQLATAPTLPAAIGALGL
ncbi:hypothetical protein ABNF97_33530 [Plantactinospora sp. B6F1]|uniref:hypothetical protein n=1 Tax=Plantactinospora sp. B6F1 TaxID=3158971 RepID=UPI0032D902A2